MLGILGGDERCPIARSLDVLGEKWTLMIVRDAVGGSTRFSQFQQSLGIPREVLTARLVSLVDGGVLERTTYKPEGARAREEYVLTDAGRDLSLVLLALGGWADRHRPSERASDLRFVDAETGEAVEAAAVTVDAQQRIPTARLRAVMEDAPAS
ncbi:winged helix-turn-helix transcriptional regulator [Curtobacterium flaccumfaciens]|uniref:winged helix-turn-helix transcriptional regulator n=1 Tax=Curtobacterium flaccumfaciens TaxID=2035 RepID=UPI001BDE6484|nr:helix-turn-helix domain-containing protein [Curtobacterium flaccumfaciens]MBT1632007.1 helix-turn-helix transcriptional regulator [Curtobacterium flaccumfaciens pv. oortii]MCX2846235.1 helix-turn-helix domain-containing protein [Curtobacterium flaccumfaciens pv. oortii]